MNAVAVEQSQPLRVLFVFAWLVVGGEETNLRLLAAHIDRRRFRIDVIPCLRLPGMPDQTHAQLEAMGMAVDRTCYALSLEDTVAYLARRIPAYDIVVSCQNVPDIYPALERLAHLRPPLIEHGGLVAEALAGPKHFTTRYVGVCETIRAAAAGRMPDRPGDARQIPSMVDPAAFVPTRRDAVRAQLGLRAGHFLTGWVGRLDRKKRVEEFIEAAALVHRRNPRARFVVVGGPDAFMPEYERELHALARRRGLGRVMQFLGDRADVPDLLVAMDAFVWLSRDEGMPHVIAEAGAAGLAVIATPDNGARQQIDDSRTGLVVPFGTPAMVAAAIARLARDQGLRRRLGAALRARVMANYSVSVVVPQWEALFDEVAAGVPAAAPPSLFRSYLQGGFECSTHRLHHGRRLDIIQATGHDANAAGDYAQLAGFGMQTVRDGLRWHLIEQRPQHHDFSSFAPMLNAAARTGTQVIWDLLHYGWPDDIDIWTPAFVDRFARFARAAALCLREHTDAVPFWCPVNEISFFAWGGGDAGYLNPFARGRGYELKVQLARASIAAMHELRAVDPRARFVHCEPLIAIHHDPATGRPLWEAEGWHEAQFQAFELLSGGMWPQIGGEPGFLDIIGLNYYSNNQWIHGGPPIDHGHPQYAPLSDLLFAVHARYGRPMFLAETGAEADRRAPWFAYVADEADRARRRGVPLEGICLYPVVNHPGWDDDRLCPNGLLGHAVDAGRRGVHQPLADVLRTARHDVGRPGAVSPWLRHAG